MRRSRKPLSVVRRIEGSNPSPSAQEHGRRTRGGRSLLGGPERPQDLVAAAVDLGRERIVLRMLAVDEVLGLLLERENDVVLEDRPVFKLRRELERVAGEARQVDSRWPTLNLSVKRRGELADGDGEVLLVAADVLLRDRDADVGGGESDEVGARRCRLGTRRRR